MLGSLPISPASDARRWKSLLLRAAVPALILTSLIASVVSAAELTTEQPVYLPGETAVIDGATFLRNETVSLQVTLLDGTPLTGPGGLPWDVPASGLGDFTTYWNVEWTYTGDTLLVTGIGNQSGEVASTSFLCPSTNLDQLQNGTITSPAEWANGNINSSNSCYSEGRSVPYRFFVKELDAGSKHYFTIQMEWTKNYVHALDYLTNYDATEALGIAAAGGPCGTISTSPPPGCTTPTASYAFRDFLNTANYTGTIPSDFFTTVNPGFVLDGPRNLKAYNVTIDSLGKYSFSGSAASRTLEFKVYFTVTSEGSVGFYWGGHLAEGNPTAWGYGNGSASVSGAPYHMRAIDFDGGGGGGDRSIQNGNICLPPSVGIICDSVRVCAGSSFTYVCRDTASTSDSWAWTVTNGTIIGSNTLDSVTFTVAPGAVPGGSVSINVESCDNTGSCPGDYCCASDAEVLPIQSCNLPPVATCAPDTSVFLCILTPICVSGFSCSDPDGNLASCQVSPGTLNGNTVCFTPTGGGVSTLRLIATDTYGAADTCFTNVTVTLNQPPDATCHGDTSMFVCSLAPITLGGYSCTDADGNLTSCVAVGGTYSTGQVTFTPVAGANTIKLIATDGCGKKDTCQTVVTVALNQPPVVSCPGDTAVTFPCVPSQICRAGFSATDPDNNIVSKTVSFGTLSNGTVCFTPDTAGLYTIIYTATDQCGAFDKCTTHVTVSYTNQPPVATCHGDTSMFVCNLTPITLGGYSCTDADGNLTSCVAVGGTYSAGQVTFTPVAGANTIKLIATDGCGKKDTCQTIVTVSVNNPPVCQIPGDQTYFVCADTSFSFTIGATDPDGNLAGCTKVSGPGQLAGGIWTFTTTGPGVYTAAFRCSDQCQAICSDTVNITVNYNSAPVVSCPGNRFYYLSELQQICQGGFACSDVDGNMTDCEVTVNGVPDQMVGGQVCFMPQWGQNVILLSAVDACGATGTCQTIITVTLPSLGCPLVKIEKTHGTLQGHFEEMAITIENGPFEMGGFDFLIAYDASALTFNEAQPGELLDTCDWEYFTYRHGVSGNCGNACPSGLLRIIALAETNNGPNHPACYGPPDTEPHELAKMTFYVTNDRTYDCQYVPIYFFWMDCGDNALSSIDGENLFIDRAIYDFEGNVIWDEEDDVQFPEDARIPFVGAPDYCLNPDPDKPSAVRCPEFVNGGIDIVCADSIDARGDINVNGVANEVADVVMLTNYFISGLSAFDTHKEASIAASDVNADGVSLSVADLVYLIRVISGDVAPYGRTASTGTVAISTNLAGGELTVSYDATTEVGAVFLIFEVDGIAGSPVLGSGASDMDVAYGQNGTELRVLIYDIGPGALASGIGEMVTIPVVGAIRLVEAEASDYYGNMMNVSTHLLPKEFSLGQNYPNPFNPTTTINLYLAEPSDWTVAIYNIAGQMIRMYSGSSDAGAVQVTWDGANSDGVKVTSGIYLYKATAGSFTATRKMVLMK